MELTAIHGIGPEYARRLREAGVPDVETLAEHQDLSSLADATGIAPARLAGFQANALDLTEPSGIAITTPMPFFDLAQTLHRAWDDAAEDLRARAMAWRDGLRTRRERAQSAAEGRAADALVTLSGAVGAVRQRLFHARQDRRRKPA